MDSITKTFSNFFANFSYYHMVGTGTKDVHGAGQRIHLMGRISSQNHWSKEGKLQQKILLKCGDFERLSKDKQSDLNRVRLFAQISEIQNTRDCSAFTLTTRHTPKLVCSKTWNFHKG